MSKLPKDAITHLTDQKGDDDEWTVTLLRNKLHKCITNREIADKQCSRKGDSTHPVGNRWSTSQVVEATLRHSINSRPKPPKDM